MLSTIWLCILLLLALQQSLTAQDAPLIETSLGKLRGSVLTSRKGRNIYAYRGIYYAKPPTGLRRFAPPEPIQPWNDTRDALADGPKCPQKLRGDLTDEDCLSLNVYTTNATASNPVIVYIHGGSNIKGSPNSEYAGPQYLLDMDVVLVGVFFRLGAFGFLSTGTADAPGNYGYLDQVLALKWVKEHIHNFGGDSNRVTLIGHSTGSYAVTLHLVSPLSAGLFRNVIAMSCSATNHHKRENLYLSRKLAYDVGCPMYEAKNLLNCLRKISWEEIINATGRWNIYGMAKKYWSYEIDDNFLLEHPTEAVRGNRFNRVPIMTGVSHNELDFEPQTIESKIDLLDDIDKNFGLYARVWLEFDTTGNDDERTKSIKQFYYNESSINRNNLLGLGQILSETLLGYTVHRLVQLAKDHTDVYYYRFDYVGEMSLFPDKAGKPQGVGHGDELLYVFKRRDFELKSSTDILMIERMTNLVASFATNGSPPIIDNIAWPPFTTDNNVVMYINSNISTGSRFYVDRYALWDKLFPLAQSSAGMQLPIVVLLAFGAAWNNLF